MKKIITFILSFIFLNLFGQNVQFSDANFKAIMLQAHRYDDDGNGYPIDSDGNGEISNEEAILCQRIWYEALDTFQNISILSFNGIQEFYNLNFFAITNANIPNIDLAEFPESITGLGFMGNQVNNIINFQHLPNLSSFNCAYNFLTSLDFSGTSISVIDCTENNLSSVNFQDSKNQYITHFYYRDNFSGDNANLLKVCVDADDIFPTITDLPALVCNSSAQYINIDPSLKRVLIRPENNNADMNWNLKDKYGNLLNSADLNGDMEIDHNEAENIGEIRLHNGFVNGRIYRNPANITLSSEQNFINLKSISCYFDPSLTGYSLSVGSFGDISAKELPNLEKIEVINGFVGSVEAIACPKLKKILSGASPYGGIYGNTLFYDIRNCPLLEDVICINGNMPDLNIENCPEIKRIIIPNNSVTALDFGYFLNLEELDVSQNQFANLDLYLYPKLKTLKCDNNYIESLDAQQCSFLEYISCSNNLLTDLNVQPCPLLEYINCSDNFITTLDVRNLNLIGGTKNYYGSDGYNFSPAFDCSNNLITTINFENTTVYGLDCSYNNITSLNNLDSDHLISLICNNNNISSLDLSNFLNLQAIKADNNILTNLSILGSTKLETLYCSNNLLTNLNFNDTKVQFLDCSFNNLSELELPVQFARIKFHDNPLLKFLFMNNGGVDYFLFDENPFLNTDLQYICVDEQDMAYVGYTLQRFGMSNVNFNSYCSFVPGGNYNTITGKVRFDENGNGCDSNDEFFEHMKLKIDDGTGSGSTFVKSDGSYNFFTSVGDFTIIAQPENPELFVVSPQNFSASFADVNNNVFTHDFCVSQNGTKNDLEVVFAPITNARPGFDAKYRLIYRNKGNTTLSGDVSLIFDTTKMDFVSSETPVSISGNQVLLPFENLKPYANKGIEIVFNIHPPTNPTQPVNIGDVLSFTATIQPILGDLHPEDNTFEFEQIVVGSFDPNDIICLEGTTIPTSMIGKYLHYQINYENTGTAEAENIVVQMDIDPEDFDIETLQLQNSSAPVYTKVIGNKVEFVMEKIRLGSGGHGSVTMKIKSQSSKTEGSNVSNKANIYFDYNFPVETNNYVTNFENQLQADEVKDHSVLIYPIPTKGEITIETKYKVLSVEVYDLTGRLVQKHVDNSKKIKLNLRENPGNYYLKIKTEKGVMVKKVMKE